MIVRLCGKSCLINVGGATSDGEWRLVGLIKDGCMSCCYILL